MLLVLFFIFCVFPCFLSFLIFLAFKTTIVLRLMNVSGTSGHADLAPSGKSCTRETFPALAMQARLHQLPAQEKKRLAGDRDVDVNNAVAVGT